jgi:hypothetical protein
MPRQRTQAAPVAAEPEIMDPVVAPIPDEQIPDFAVAERRLKHGDMDVLREPPITLVKQPTKMVLRWGNSRQEGRIDRLTRIKGWRPVTPEELPQALSFYGFTKSPDGFVVRGEKGQEVLLKMPRSLYDGIQQRKSDDLLRKMRSSKHVKEAAVGQMQGDADADGTDARRRETLLRGSDRLSRSMHLEMEESSELVPLEDD